MRNVIIRITFMLLVLISSCKKDEAEWEWCTDCQQEAILGEYTGLANYLRFTDVENFIQKNNQEVTLSLKETSTGLQSATSVINVFYSSLSGTYDSSYYLQLAGNQQSFSAIIWRKENQIKLVGTIKKTDSEGEIREVLDFEVVREE
ncbi:MAG: hypothetical protein HOO86_13330 [Bacteroidales bacterium]|nr:hypothetical protein [Bacteroidales bacterium]